MSLIELEPADPAVLRRSAEIVAALQRIVGATGVIATEEGRRTFECDGLAAYRAMPLAVVLPASTEEVSRVLAYCHAEGVKVVPRGAGTSLAGGALPREDGIVLGVSRMSRVLETDLDSRAIRVEAGITNLAVSAAIEAEGWFYAPDPSSQLACTIAGNIAMNSGGAHCLRYGVTTNNVLGVRMVLMTGEVIDIGGTALDAAGYDLLGLIVGSEGQLGIVTEATLRILPKPEAARPMLVAFPSSEAAGACVAAIIGSGIVPVALELMDKPALEIVEDFAQAGYPREAGALLIIEVEGAEEEIDALTERMTVIARRHGATLVRESSSPEESAAIWKGRKSAFGAMGRIADYLCMDGTIPVRQLPSTLRRIGEICAVHGFRVANIFHAGDGNLHPLILYDANKPGELERVEACGAEILRHCVEVGGSITGEHGVGIEKRDLMPLQFSNADLQQQMRIKSAFDEAWLLNPGKVFPLDKRRAA